jgi:hypothetical protein
MKGGVAAIPEAAGPADVETAHLAATISYASFDDLWQPLLSGSTPVTAAVAALPPAAREQMHRRLAERFLGESHNGSFSLQAEASRSAAGSGGRPGCDNRRELDRAEA